MAEELRELIAKRGKIKARITRLEHALQNFGEADDVSSLKLRKSLVEPSWKEFDDIQSQIESIDQSVKQEDEREYFEASYIKVMTDVDELITNRLASCDRGTSFANLARRADGMSNIESAVNSQVKLPILNLPTFNGSCEQWLSFQETFTSLIHDNTTITDIQKFYYLKSCLKDEANNLINALSVTTDNYAIAWELLRKRYHNTRLIIKTQVNNLFNLPNVTKDSPTSLRQLLDKVQLHLKVLNSLGVPTEAWDVLIIHLITSRLDFITMREWEATIKKDLPTMSEMTQFLSRKCQLLESIHCHKSSTAISSTHNNMQNNKITKIAYRTTTHMATSKPSCPICKQIHFIHYCKKFLDLPIEARIAQIKTHKLCLNCLKANHESSQCRAGTCKRCDKKHNTLLHLPHTTTDTGDVKQTNTSVNAHCCNTIANSCVLLSTALVQIYDNNGKQHECRALLDPGSESNFITESMSQKLGLKTKSVSAVISGINQASNTAHFVTTIKIKSCYNAFTSTVNCLVIPTITESLPLFNIELVNFNIPNKLTLADPKFNISNPIDVLLGADIFWDLMCIGQIRTSKQQPQLQKTHLGWIVGGRVSISNAAQTDLTRKSITNYSTLKAIDNQITKFWEIEQISDRQIYSKDDVDCENQFVKNHSRDENGHFIVQLPFKRNAKLLGLSREIAMKRFVALERRFKKQPNLKERYVKFMAEYLKLGHMGVVPATEAVEPNGAYYLPHTAVVKESSITTKLRVVFDGSAKTTSGISLNDNLMAGPSLQQSLFSIITRFRTYQFVLTADIQKMYRQIWIHSSDRKYQRIIWREDESQPMQTYELNTVTYGTTSAPFLAIRCMQQLGHENKTNNPLAHKVILNDFYVDDMLTGANTLSELYKIRDQVINVLKEGGFNLTKWASNYIDLIRSTDQIISPEAITFNFDKNGDTKTLGLMWNCHKDNIKYAITDIDVKKKVSKRSILSAVAQLFDPLGLVGPVLINAKIILQRLWSLKLNWDESIPMDLHTTWLHFVNQLSMLKDLKIPRKVIQDNATSVELHGFCDASEKAYGAAIYIRSHDRNNTCTVRLLCAKSRIAPLKTVSMPRLELCGALLLTQLVSKLSISLELNITRTAYWTDSKIVLAWLAGEPNTWKTFVATRVSEIQSKSNPEDWNYVNSQTNPADIISRGTSAAQLISSKLWWKGPDWLAEHACKEQSKGYELDSLLIPEARKLVMTATITSKMLPVFLKFSSFTQLNRVIAFCFKFANNARRNKSNNGALSCKELQAATTCILKVLQQYEFPQEIHKLKAGLPISKQSKLRTLSPFIDHDGLIRVGGRLRNTKLFYDVKHPVLLPKHHITNLIVLQEHLRLLHGGQQMILSSLRQRYWPISGRNIVKKIIRSCVTCFRAKPRVINPLMGSLPVNRVQVARPFSNCGVDYAGPLPMLEGKGRGKRIIKVYVALFVCFATKAVHLELVGDLTTESFLGALKRFISRRGTVVNMYSDNATNFVGANRELQSLHKFLNSKSFESDVINNITNDNITWHFIPPRSPHHGGIWEAGIKSVKHHLKRVIGDTSLLYEELYTLLTRIEACLNSRPLTPLSNDVNDLTPLTPSHFLIGDLLTNPPEPDTTGLKINRLSRWQHTEQMRQHFWKRWSTEYLTQLHQRSKWQRHPDTTIKINDLVLLKDDNLPPLKWKLGRVVKLHPGNDNITRVVSIKTASDIVTRAVTKVCVLPVE